MVSNSYDESIVNMRNVFCFSVKAILCPCMKINKIKHTRVSKIKNEIQRIDWKIIERLVRLLYYHSKLKRTHISTKCNLSYDKCCRYLDWMEVMNLIIKEKNEEGFEVVLLTEQGGALYNKKFRDMKKELSYG